MPEIVLTEEQARVLAGATTAVLIRDPRGATVGLIDPKEAEVIAEARRRLAAEKGQSIPADRVRAHLAALQAEWDRMGGFDLDYARRFLDKLRAEDRNG